MMKAMEDLMVKYQEELKKVNKLNLLIIGQDPYPYGANGIAFCKNTFEELFSTNCCGKDVLKSLGFDQDYLRENFETPIDFFIQQLKKGIAFINVSASVKNKTKQALLETKEYNSDFIKKAKSIVVLGKGKTNELFKEYYPEINVNEILIHPSGYNKASNYSEWAKVWNSNYLNKYLKSNNLKSNTMEARFFIADACFNTWKKIYVLTSDGTLYSEYLDYMRPVTDRRTVDFSSFAQEDYSFGGYHKLREVSKSEATSAVLTRQGNWVSSYLNRKIK